MFINSLLEPIGEYNRKRREERNLKRQKDRESRSSKSLANSPLPAKPVSTTPEAKLGLVIGFKKVSKLLHHRIRFSEKDDSSVPGIRVVIVCRGDATPAVLASHFPQLIAQIPNKSCVHSEMSKMNDTDDEHGAIRLLGFHKEGVEAKLAHAVGISRVFVFAILVHLIFLFSCLITRVNRRERLTGMSLFKTSMPSSNLSHRTGCIPILLLPINLYEFVQLTHI